MADKHPHEMDAEERAEYRRQRQQEELKQRERSLTETSNSIPESAKTFQVLSRNNDINGNPYRLVLVYNAEAIIVAAFEARSSSPNIVHYIGLLRRENRRVLHQLPTFHLSPSEYNATKKNIVDLAKKYDDHPSLIHTH